MYSAQAKVKEAELNLGYATIRSPVTGLASRSAAARGRLPERPVAGLEAHLRRGDRPDLGDLQRLAEPGCQAWREMAAEEAGRLSRRTSSTRSSSMLSDGTRYPHTGKINFADPSFSQDTGIVHGARRAAQPDERRCGPGMFVTAYVKGAMRPDAIVVPQLAVQQGSQRPPGLRRQRRRAARRCGRSWSATTSATTGHRRRRPACTAGDRVVVDGVLKVVPGTPVKIAAAGAAGGSRRRGGQAGSRGQPRRPKK
ncbi:MAG: hypothetical protein MZW92_51910 [Comamonadaceae bacterium]|nr:hypothetical protein [Comamonadaceae bacterium]